MPKERVTADCCPLRAWERVRDRGLLSARAWERVRKRGLFQEATTRDLSQAHRRCLLVGPVA
jgi:hypothetical protein